MFDWIKLALGIVSLLRWITQQIDADALRRSGISEALDALQNETQVRVENANKARADSERESDTGGLHNDDGYRRD